MVVGTGMNRAGFLRRGAVGGGALLVSGAGLGTLGLPGVASADTPSDGDLAYLRLLIAAELLAIDFQGKALRSRKLKHAAHSLFARILSDEQKHYTQLAALLTDAGGTPATADDIDFSYPKGTFRTQASITRLAGRLEHLMVGAYLGAVESVETPALRLPMGQIAANEAQHQGALAALQGQPVVGKPFAPALQIGAVSDALDAFES
jgi:rubrerythrin